MREEWKEVYGYNILYEVSNLGRVRTKYTQSKVYGSTYNYLTPIDNGNGYLRFNWKSKNVNHTVYLHRLVATAFLDNPHGYHEVNHKDEDKKNNRADNLEWCDHDYNAGYGTKNFRAAETRRKRKLIECIDTGIVYKSLQDVMDEYGVSKTAISNCLSGRSKTCAGKRWRYLSDVYSRQLLPE